MNKFLFFGRAIDESTMSIEGDDFRHCIKVLRNSEGDSILLTDGNGHLITGHIKEIERNQASVKIVDKEHHEARPRKLHLAIAPTKNISRIEMMLEKCTEMGVEEFSFILCQNSERRNIKIERLKKIVLSAVKQSFQFHMPKLNDLISLQDFLMAHQDDPFGKYLLHYQEGTPHLAEADWKENNILLVGPEGDFTKEEIALCKQQNYEPKILGSNRLRTETAGLVSCSIFNVSNR